jgi:hypothetical protein
VSCAETMEIFDTIVLIELMSKDGSSVPNDEATLLGNTFANAYNDLSFTMCDDLFRNVNYTSFSLANVRRRLNTDDNVGYVLTAQAKIKGTCKGVGCSLTVSPAMSLPIDRESDTKPIIKAAGLFSGLESSVRRLGQHKLVHSYPHETLAPTGCVCRATTQLLRAPSSEEFITKYDKTLSDLSNQRILHSINGAGEVREVFEVEGCGHPIEEFDVIVLVDLETSRIPSAVDNSELTLLGNSFAKDYNDMTNALCDPIFRTIRNITVEVESTRRQLIVGERKMQGLLFSLTVKVKINGSCKGVGCSQHISGSLSDDTRSTSSSGESGIFARKGRPRPLGEFKANLSRNSALGCFCDKATSDFRSPTAKEFITKYDSTLIQLANQNILSGVIRATAVNDVVSIDGCSNPVEEFDAAVLIELTAGNDDMASVSQPELTVLGDIFRMDYNNLSVSLCDPMFRRIGNVSVELQNVGRRRLVTDNGITRDLGVYILTGKAIIKGTCKGIGCSNAVTNSSVSSAQPTTSTDNTLSSPGTGLFSSSKRRLWETFKPHVSRNLADKCLCNPSTADFRSPSDTEFVGTYDGSIITLANKGVLRSIGGALSVEQITVVTSCDDVEEENFETALLVNVSVSDVQNALTQDESFGDALIESYNDLSASLCDPWNRNLKKVSKLPDLSTRRLMDGIVSVSLSGTCKGQGCSSTVTKHGIFTRPLLDREKLEQFYDNSSFSDVILSFEDSQKENNRALSVPQACFCDVSGAEQRAPTEAEVITNVFSRLGST